MVPRMLAALVALLTLPAVADASGPWYVSKSGNNANTCLDTAHACLTIGAAVTKSATGDTINIGAGTFNESVNAAGKALIFNGAGSDPATGTVVDGHGAGSPFILTNGGALHALRATEDSAATISAGSAGGSRALAITSSVILADGFQAPLDAETTGGSLAVTITDSTLQQTQPTAGGSEYGVLLSGSIGASLVRSTVSSVMGAAVAGALGVDITASDSTMSGTTGLADNNATLHVYRCHITGTTDEGIYSSSIAGAGADQSTLIEDSLVRGTTRGLFVHANSVGKSNTATVHDSTLVASGPAAVDGVLADAFNSATSTVNVDGSIVTSASTGGGLARDLHADQAAATIGASYSSFSSVLATFGGTVPAPASGSNISGDPMFANPAGGDFSLQQSSPLIDKGDQAGVVANEKDLTGGTRVLDGNGDGTATVDVGALEHTYAPPPPAGGGGGGGGNPPPPATDTTPPALTKVSIRNAKLRFTLSEAARVTVTITKGKGARRTRVRRFTVTGKLGLNAAAFKKLKAGSYRMTLSAVDGSGNRSKPFARAFKVKRRRA